jgi:hypothetical protein
MRVTIDDPKALGLVRLFQLQNYLAQHGWKKLRSYGNNAEVFSHPVGHSKSHRILVPTDPSVDDFVERVQSAIHIAADLEGRSASSVYRDMVTTDADLLRIRFVAEETANGSIPAERGVALFQGAKDLMMASACATLAPAASFANRKPEQATQYLRDLRFGQTEEGSFIVTLLSFLRQESTPEGALFANVMPTPYERKVVETASRAVAELGAAVQKSRQHTDGTDLFRAAVPLGVSANLCEAVSALLDGAVKEASVEFRVSWSTARPFDVDVPTVTTFTANDVPILKSAAERLRDEEPRVGFELVGSVVDLHRGPSDDLGKIKVAAFVDGKPKRVEVLLGDADYNVAVAAHKARELFKCEGRLVKASKGWELLNAEKAVLFTQSSNE